jgi:hypothetical protein
MKEFKLSLCLSDNGNSALDGNVVHPHKEAKFN